MSQTGHALNVVFYENGGARLQVSVHATQYREGPARPKRYAPIARTTVLLLHFKRQSSRDLAAAQVSAIFYNRIYCCTNYKLQLYLPGLAWPSLYEKLTAEMTHAQPQVKDCGDCGMYVDVYKWNGQSLGSQNGRNW